MQTQTSDRQAASQLMSACSKITACAGSREFGAGLTDAVATALERHPGDVLVFLPGVGEIRAADRQLLGARMPGPPVAVLPLHGMLGPAEQDEALRPQPGPRYTLYPIPYTLLHPHMSTLAHT